MDETLVACCSASSAAKEIATFQFTKFLIAKQCRAASEKMLATYVKQE